MYFQAETILLQSFGFSNDKHELSIVYITIVLLFFENMRKHNFWA